MANQTNRNAQLLRILRVITDLDTPGGVDIYVLAERNGTSIRTIRRDLEALEAVGLPIIEESIGRRKHWRVAFDNRLSRLAGHLRLIVERTLADGKNSRRAVTCRIAFTPEVAGAVRARKWHHSQRFENGKKESVIMAVTVRPSTEWVSWIASWMMDAEVIEPAQMRRELRSFGRWLVRTYTD